MTTHYTTTVGITTPAVTLTDFTSVVPGDLGVNVYGGALNADINTFDIGPTGDSNILLQTLQVGGHHVHDGVCHDSHTPSGPSFGVHGIYDKAAGSLIERVEFYNHPAGQGYSARYGNACASCVFHDTPFAIALFNYQGAAIGPNGTLRIRDAIFYNIAADGYIFFSDGVWKESNGTVLGDSLISVEIDHCTIDIRGITDPFNFSDMHNDVYLTNCVIISDSGLPLSSIIVAPIDGSTVHLDGSIVLSSADAATYLGPAPTFTPIAVGGSPVIGTAVASPPVTFTEFGNEGDLGATQTGSMPPGPPPLPGPTLPTLEATVVGSVDSSGSDVVILPISVDVPRSSPASGTVIFIFYQADNVSNATVSSAVDDADPEDAYSLCIFADGLNHYNATPFPAMGLVVNDLIGGVNNITLVLSGVPSAFHAVAVAITGINFAQAGPIDPTLPDIVGLLQPAEQPVGGGGSSAASGSGWNCNSDGTVTFFSPAGTVDTLWDFVSGALAFYYVSGTLVDDGAGWTWNDGTIVDFVQWDIADGNGHFLIFALGLQNPMSPGAAAPSVEGVLGSAGSQFGMGGIGIAVPAGLGPFCTTPPPPGGGTPILHGHIRLSE